MFDEDLFPPEISYGSQGGPGYTTDTTVMPNRAEQRVSRTEYPQHRYDVSKSITTMATLSQVLTFYNARGGAAVGFRFLDYADYHSDPDNPSYTAFGTDLTDPAQLGEQDQLIGVGDGTTTQFQLIKRYVSGGRTRVRKILKPIEDFVRIWVDGVELVDGVDFTVNHTTGIVTFNTAPAEDAPIEASYAFHVPVRFEKDTDDQLRHAFRDFNAQTIPSITLIEEMDPAPSNIGQHYFGGHYERALSADLTLSTGLGRLIVLNMLVTGRSVILPTPTNLPTGEYYFTVVNEGSNSFALKSHGGATLVTLAAGKAARVLLSEDMAATKVWYAING